MSIVLGLDRDNPNRLKSVTSGETFATATPNKLLVAAQTGYRIGIHAFWLVSSATTGWAFLSGGTATSAGLDITGTIPATVRFCPYPFYLGGDGATVRLTSSTAASHQIRWACVYGYYKTDNPAILPVP